MHSVGNPFPPRLGPRLVTRRSLRERHPPITRHVIPYDESACVVPDRFLRAYVPSCLRAFLRLRPSQPRPALVPRNEEKDSCKRSHFPAWRGQERGLDLEKMASFPPNEPILPSARPAKNRRTPTPRTFGSVATASTSTTMAQSICATSLYCKRPSTKCETTGLETGRRPIRFAAARSTQ